MIHELGLLFSLLACGGYIWSNVDPCWKKTSGDFNVQPYDICYGLYKSCTITSVGEWLCDNNLSETPLDLGIPGTCSKYDKLFWFVECYLIRHTRHTYRTREQNNEHDQINVGNRNQHYRIWTGTYCLTSRESFECHECEVWTCGDIHFSPLL